MRRLVVGVAALLVGAVTSPSWAQTPTARVTIHPPLIATATPAPQGTYTCEGFAAAPEPWYTAFAQLWLKLDNRQIGYNSFTANYWGATGTVGASVDPTLSNQTLLCEIYVSVNDCGPCGSASSSAQLTIEPRRPQDLKSVPPDQLTYTSPGDYLRTRIWQVWDNYQLPWTYANFPVTETFTEAGPNGCGLTIQTGDTVTNADGRFQDKYGNWDGLHPILQCRVDPSCTSPFTQTITVAGVPFSHGVTYGCSDVQITRQ